MKKQLLKKLSAFIVTAILFSTSANAQIVYTDVNPDTVISAVILPSTINYNIDLNNDGINDYNISCVRNRFACGTFGSRGSTNYVFVSALNTNAVVVDTSKTYPLAMNFNDNIYSGLNFSASGYLRYVRGAFNCGNTVLGFWSTSVDHYLGLKLIVGANTYYGWVRLQVSVSGNASCTIKDYAYNSIPNQPIRAGETSCTTATAKLAASGSLSFCAGDSVILTANGTGYQYQWKRNNVNITGANLKTYVAKRAGTYKCEVTNSCGSTISLGRKVTVTCRPSNKVMAEQVESPYELKIAPNPISSSTTVSFSINHAEKVSIKVVDLNGRLITTLANHLFKEGVHSIVWKAENVRSGIYLLQIRTAEYSRTEKLIVTK